MFKASMGCIKPYVEKKKEEEEEVAEKYEEEEEKETSAWRQSQSTAAS